MTLATPSQQPLPQRRTTCRPNFWALRRPRVDRTPRTTTPTRAPEDRMNPQLTYLLVQARHSELICRAEKARLAGEARRTLRQRHAPRSYARPTPTRYPASAQACNAWRAPGGAWLHNPQHECASCDQREHVRTSRACARHAASDRLISPADGTPITYLRPGWPPRTVSLWPACSPASSPITRAAPASSLPKPGPVSA